MRDASDTEGEEQDDLTPDEERADAEAWIACPYCGVEVELVLDPGGGAVQRYVEDCEVCCRPWHLTVRWDSSGAAQVEARTEGDA